MSISYDAPTGIIRGSEKEIVALRARLRRLKDASGIPAALQEAGLPVPADDPVLTSVQAALAAPMMTLTLVNAGPGGTQRHVIDSGVNAVSVRWSTARPDLSELAPSPFTLLPGMMARLVRFQPGRPPKQSAQPVVVEPRIVEELVADSTQVRLAAWDQLRPQLGDLIDPQEADASWQVVEARCAWTAASDGEQVEQLAVYLRAGDAYFVLLESEDSFDLVPVPSVTAWEVMVQVLPGADEVKDPRKD